MTTARKSPPPVPGGWRLDSLPLRNHFTSHGKPKRPYATRIEAQEAAARYGGNAYRCDFCKKYHTGGRA